MVFAARNSPSADARQQGDRLRVTSSQRSHSIALAICLVALFVSSTAIRADEPLFFEDTVRPFLRARCFSCHGEDDKREGTLDTRSLSHLRKGGDSGPAVVPGNRETSSLYLRIRDGEMPPEGLPGFTPAEIEQIGKWIDGGAKSRRPDDDATSWITAEDRAFWSFQPLATHAAPTVASEAAPAGPVDAWLLKELDRQNLSTATPADRRVLLRRLSLTLIGLPPDQADVERFIADTSPDAYAREVDRLLASPQFGERWSRYWLDLVRYVDKTPDYLASADNAWLYRDWIIRSWNEDRPYDEFVQLQLAADHADSVPATDLAALGFLGLSPTYWKELRLAPSVIKTIVADEWDERIDTITRTFLGLTVSCARCHNHKFDPVSMEDYYALAGIVASSQLTDRPLLEEPQASRVRAARRQVEQWDAEVKELTATVSALAPILNSKIERLKGTTPNYSAPWAHVVEDASLLVLPQGDDATRLETKPGMTADLPIFLRGNPDNTGDVVPRRFLEILSRDPKRTFTKGSGRTEFAEALLADSPQLVARVIVNRLWAGIFGRGLVSTTSDFGRQGERPTHPELLDHLAQRLIDSGWSLKTIVREIVLTDAFQRSSTASEDIVAGDPDARWLSRFPTRRLDLEAWRDSLAQAVGILDDRMYGVATPLNNPEFRRRTLYGRIEREELETVLRLFDFPEASVHSPSRDSTTTALQQLYVLNSTAMTRFGDEFASRIQSSGASVEDGITEAYSRLFQRAPTPNELRVGVAFLEQSMGDATSSQLAWSGYLQVLLGLNEAMYLE